MRPDLMKAMQRKDLEIRKLRDLSARQREKIIELEVKIAKLEKSLKETKKR